MFHFESNEFYSASVCHCLNLSMFIRHVDVFSPKRRIHCEAVMCCVDHVWIQGIITSVMLRYFYLLLFFHFMRKIANKYNWFKSCLTQQCIFHLYNNKKLLCHRKQSLKGKYVNTLHQMIYKTSTTPSCSEPILAQTLQANSVPRAVFSHIMPKMDFYYTKWKYTKMIVGKNTVKW